MTNPATAAAARTLTRGWLRGRLAAAAIGPAEQHIFYYSNKHVLTLQIGKYVPSKRHNILLYNVFYRVFPLDRLWIWIVEGW